MEKYKVVRKKKTGEIFVEYDKVKDKNIFRLDMIKKLVKDKPFIISIDTNIMNVEDPIQLAKRYEVFFKENEIPHLIKPIENRQDKKIFGITIAKGKGSQYQIMFSIPVSDLTEELFNQYLKEADLFFGIEPLKDVDEIFEDSKKGYLDSFFNKEYFKYALYDSIFVARMRSTIDLD